MAGLKICTRCRAISARRSRRISSSLLPENIGPTTTSIQPILPLTMSTFAPSKAVSVPGHKYQASRVPLPDCNGAGKPVDCNGELHSIFENFVRQRFGNFDAPGSAVVAPYTIGNVGPA